MIKNILISGVGGQGVITAGRIISEAAVSSGINVVMSELHGLSQRGGSVSVDLRMGDVHGPIIPDGDVDVIMGFEPIEAIRAISRAGNRTIVIMNSEKITPISLSMHRMEYPDEEKLKEISGKNVKIMKINGVMIAKKAGNYKAVNSVMIGATLGLDIIPVTMESVKSVMKGIFSGNILQENLKAIDLGREEIMEQEAWN